MFKPKSAIKLLALVLALILALAACAPVAPAAETQAPVTEAPVETAAPPEEAPAGEPITMVDGLNRSVTLQGPAQRVVSLAPSNTEILFAVDAGDQAVGRDEFSDYPARAQNLPSVGGSFGEYNLESMVDLQPDLVLAAEINPPELIQSIEDVGLTVFMVPNPTDLDGVYESILTVAALTGHDAEAFRLVQELQGRAQAVLQKTENIDDRPLVFYELDSTDPSAPYTAGSGTFIDLLIDKAGGTNLGAAMPDSWGQMSVEELVVQNPNVILLGDAAYGVTVESVGQRPGWEEIDAVQNGRIYTFDDDLVSRPGPRLIDGLETLARLLHPELF